MKRLYVYCVLVSQHNTTSVQPAAVYGAHVASDSAQAKGYALEHAQSSYPVAERWRIDTVSVVPVADATIESAGWVRPTLEGVS